MTDRIKHSTSPLTTFSNVKNNSLERAKSFCFNCGIDDHYPLYKANDFDFGTTEYSIIRCQNCGLSFTDSITTDVLKTAYSKDYYGGSNSKFFGFIELLISYGHMQQAKKILSLHTNSSTKIDHPRVLDIGCGRALLLQEFEKLGALCLGIERKEFPTRDYSNIEFHIGSLTDPELANRTFDIIVLWHVLEHITELGSLLKQLGSHVEPEGLLVISVPNFSSWQSRFFKEHWFHLDIPRHVNHFTYTWLKNELDRLGFSIVKKSSYTPSQNIYGFIQSALNKISPHKPNQLYKLLMRRQGWKDWLALSFWSTLAIFILPIAIIEMLVSEMSLQGATITIYARHNTNVNKLK